MLVCINVCPCVSNRLFVRAMSLCVRNLYGCPYCMYAVRYGCARVFEYAYCMNVCMCVCINIVVCMWVVYGGMPWCYSHCVCLSRIGGRYCAHGLR